MRRVLSRPFSSSGLFFSFQSRITKWKRKKVDSSGKWWQNGDKKLTKNLFSRFVSKNVRIIEMISTQGWKNTRTFVREQSGSCSCSRTITEREQKNYKSGEQEQNENKIFVLFFQIKCLVLGLSVQENMSLICKGLKVNGRAKVDWGLT